MSPPLGSGPQGRRQLGEYHRAPIPTGALAPVGLECKIAATLYLSCLVPMSVLAQNPSETTRNRVDWVDAAKGAMIVLVVFGHTWRGLETSGLVPPALFTLIDSRIYAFHMPVFFTLSGWFFISSLRKTTLAHFYRSRVHRLFWPMVLWTYLFLGMKVMAGSLSNTPIAIKDLLILPVPGILHMWFLWALLVLSFTFSLLKPFSQSARGLTLALAGAVCLVIILLSADLGPNTIHWVGTAITNAPFFLLGLVFGHLQVMRHLPQSPLIAAIVFAAGLVFWPFLVTNGLTLPGSLLLVFCILMFFASLPNENRAYRLCLQLGAASMAIYLAHTIFAAALREVLMVLGVKTLWLHVLTGTLIGVTGPMVLLALARRTGTQRLLGF